jgi:hypothetical protein
LDDALVIFDSQILDARRKVLGEPGRPDSEPSDNVDLKDQDQGGGEVAGAGPGEEPTVAATEDGAAGGAQGEEDSAGEQPAEGGDETGASSDRSGRTPTAEGVMAAAGAVPDDIPDGQDDDIVARQLRELAMAETDPVLREKYWDEYRRYKKGTGK